MAEAATVIELIHFSSVVLSRCYTYITRARHAPNEIQRSIDEVSSLKSILENLKSLADNSSDERFALLKSLNSANGTFQASMAALKALEKRLAALSECSSVQRRLQWSLEAGKIDEDLQRISQHKTKMILALAGDTAILADEIADGINDLRRSVDEMKNQEHRSRILEWLKGTDPSANYDAARKKKESGTCEWLLQLEDFEAFVTGEQQLFWLHGKPGTGKTILTSAVIDYLATSSVNDPKVVVYYFFDFNDKTKQTYFGFLLSLVRQIYMQSDSDCKDIDGLYEYCKGATPTSEQLLRSLILLLGHGPRIFIVVDALDECKLTEEEEERMAVLEALTEIKSSASGRFNIFITSRPEADISRVLLGICDVNLDVQIASVNEDIQRHVRSYIAKDDRLKIWPENVKKEIEDKLTANVNGMFRWAACQLAELRKCFKLPNIRRELNNLPQTLDATYERIIKSIPDLYQREMKAVLALLSFSARPMSIQEVAEATAVNLETQCFTPDERFHDPYVLLEFCSSLVSLVSPGDTGSDWRREGIFRFSQPPAAVQLLQFAHFSVKEYLISDRTQKSIPYALRISEYLSHSHIAQTSLIYLLDFNNGRRVSQFDHKEFPFLAYSALHWTTHLSAMDPSDHHSIEPLILRLFDPMKEDNLLNYLNLYDPSRASMCSKGYKELNVGPPKHNKQDFGPPIYYASLYGLLPVIQYLLSGGESTRPTKEALGSGVAAAASGGYPDIVALLLREGADPNSPYSGTFHSPLHAAASSGNPTIVKQLLDAGSLVNGYAGSDGSALHVAAQQGNREVVQLLIDYGADLHVWGDIKGPPLCAALYANEHEVVATLLRSNVDVNIPPSGYFNPLSLACKNTGIETIRLLLDKGADVSLKRPGNAALHNAAERGDIAIMQLLLHNGADINEASCGTYRTALKGAIQSHAQPAFEFMLRTGADISFRGRATMYPIDQAILSGNLKAAERLIELGATFSDQALAEALDWHTKEYLVKILLEHGANPNAEHKEYGNLLQLAAYKESPATVKWLLEAGANPNDISGGEYGTPLQATAYVGEEEVICLLLEYGAEVNPMPSGRWGSPLQAAIVTKNESIIKLLLDHEAAIDATGGELGNNLQAAAGAGLERVVRLFISKGIDVNAPPCGKYGTALRAALANNHEHIVELLLMHRADASSEITVEHSTHQCRHWIKTYSSALEVAAATNNPNLVQLLLDHGVDINASGNSCSRALQRASEMPDLAVLKFLIEKGADVRQFGGAALSYERNIEGVQLLLKHGANPSGDLSQNSPTPLSSAIRENQWDIMRMLLDAGANVNATFQHYTHNRSALHEAIYSVSIDAVKELIVRGVDVNLRAGSWGTPLTQACMMGGEELFRVLLDHGAEINPNPPYGYWGTPLQAAICKGYYKMANALLDDGANPHAAGVYASPLIAACAGGGASQLDLIKRLISLGVDLEAVDIHRPEDDDMVGTRFYWTALQLASYSGNEQVVQLLLENGANINPSGPKGTWGFPLQAAAEQKNQAMVKFLLERGAHVNAVGGNFGTALQAAAVKGSDSIINLLLGAGADATLEGGYYGSPLQAVARIGKERHVQFFLDRGVPINTNIGKYGNPLAAAAKRAHHDVVAMLIEYGANVNQGGGKYGSPLQAACCASGSTAADAQGSVVKLLLENGADVDGKGGKYGTALQAAAYHDKQYVEILLRHGADLNARSGKFGSALAAARKKGLVRTEMLLLAHGALDEE